MYKRDLMGLGGVIPIQMEWRLTTQARRDAHTDGTITRNLDRFSDLSIVHHIVVDKDI